MNPLQYEERYHKLTVPLDGGLGTTTVDVRRYQNNDEKLKSNEAWGNREALKHKDQLVGRMITQVAQLQRAAAAKPRPAEVLDRLTPMGELVEEYGASRALEIRNVEMSGATAAVWSRYNAARAVHLSNAEVLRQLIPHMMDIHSGKGSPEEIAQALHLVSRYGLYDPIYANDPAAGVRDYCDRYIGLDCNGFVGNYARANGKAKVPNTEIRLYAPANARRATIEDVQADDVLVWPDYGHIAVIHSIEPITTGPDGKPARDCVVVESSAGNPSKGTRTRDGGLQHSTYSIRSVQDRVFQVERPRGDPRNKVYIAPLT